MRTRKMFWVTAGAWALSAPAWAAGDATPASMPPSSYEDVGLCPGECCTYREWSVEKPVTLHEHRDSASPVAYVAEKGEWVTGVTGVVITVKPGKAVVRRPIVLGYDDGDMMQAKPGETLHLLNYQGEGFFKFLLRGRILSDEIPFVENNAANAAIHTESEPKTVWWVKVKNRAGKIGWTDKPDAFGNMDACG